MLTAEQNYKLVCQLIRQLPDDEAEALFVAAFLAANVGVAIGSSDQKVLDAVRVALSQLRGKHN